MNPHRPARLRSLIGRCLVAALAGSLAQGCGSSNRSPSGPPPEIAFASAGSLREVAQGASAFAWLPGRSGVVIPDARYDGALVDATIRGEITGVLLEKGFPMQDAAHADRFITFALGLDDQLSDDRMDAIFGLRPGLPADDQVPRGTLAIVITDARTGEVMYRAAAQAFATFDLPREQRLLRVRGAVRRLLDAMPRRAG